MNTSLWPVFTRFTRMFVALPRLAAIAKPPIAIVMVRICITTSLAISVLLLLQYVATAAIQADPKQACDLIATEDVEQAVGQHVAHVARLDSTDVFLGSYCRFIILREASPFVVSVAYSDPCSSGSCPERGVRSLINTPDDIINATLMTDIGIAAVWSETRTNVSLTVAIDKKRFLSISIERTTPVERANEFEVCRMLAAIAMMRAG